MEEQRISMMYVNLIKRWFIQIWDRLFGDGSLRSPLLPWLVLLAILVPPVGWTLHMHGKFANFKRQVRGRTQDPVVVAPRPGGADPLVLTRQRTPGANIPEFVSATVLPGLGMQVLQLTAFLPGVGEADLFAAPTVQQMADLNPDGHPGGPELEGALEAPWGGMLVGLVPPAGGALEMLWRGRTFELPAPAVNAHGVIGGGLLTLESVDATQQVQGSLVSASGSLTATDFNGRWPSKTDLHMVVGLAAETLELTVTALNSGSEPSPMGIGWQPRFRVVSGDGAQVELRLPEGEQLQAGARGVPTGKIEPAGPGLARFQGHTQPLGREPVEGRLVHLKSAALDAGAVAEYRDPASGYGIRMTSLSPAMREFQVSAPVAAKTVSFGMQTNLDDPLNPVWSSQPGGGITVLQPGQSLQWKVRLEIFPLTRRDSAAR